MLDMNEIKKHELTYSQERLLSFAYSANDTIENITANYKKNIQISQAIYPELCTLEVILRNAIDNLLKTRVSATWVEDEIKHNSFLEPYDYQTLVSAYNDTKQDCLKSKKPFTIGKVIANLNFGFWTNLCVKRYNSKIWNKPAWFNSVFVNCPFSHKAINNISIKLYTIRRFRNRVFHYEKVFKHPQRTLSLYNDILQMLSYLPNDDLEMLKSTSTFLATYNQLTK